MSEIRRKERQRIDHLVFIANILKMRIPVTHRLVASPPCLLPDVVTSYKGQIHLLLCNRRLGREVLLPPDVVSSSRNCFFGGLSRALVDDSAQLQ